MITVFTGCDFVAPERHENTTTVTRQALQLLEEIGQQELRQTPELASRLGLAPEVVGYDHRSVLDDRSQAAFERMRVKRLEYLSKLEQLQDKRLSFGPSRDLMVTLDAFDDVIEMSAFGHGQVSLSYAKPFVADHLSGAYIELQDLLLFRQTVLDAADAEAFLSRMSLMPDALDDDRRRLIADAEAGITPPDFILRRMIDHCQSLMSEDDAAIHPIIAVFERRLAAANDLDEAQKQDKLTDATILIKNDILPAYTRFIDALTALEQRASNEPGIWHLPEGTAYYDAVIDLYAGKQVSPDTLYSQGQSIVESLTGTIDLKLQEAGFLDGSVGERLASLAQTDDQILTDDEEGRAQLLARMTAIYEAVLPHLEKIVSAPRTPTLSISPTPEVLKSATPSAYYTSATGDGSAPAVFHVDLTTLSDWPDFSLPALVVHETVPGHHLERTYPQETSAGSLVRQLIWPVAYGEGWALYAEDIAFELGLYADIPFAEIGYLQSLLFRAARMVADTGIHHKEWSRQKAVDYLVSVTGHSEQAMADEVDRYSVWPGQAVAYMVGRNEIIRLRTRAEGVLGSRFNLAGFHHAILAGGPRPFSYVEADIDAWIVEELSR